MVNQYLGPIARIKTQSVDDTWDQLFDFFCMNFYIINKNAANKLLEKAYPIDLQIDGFLSKYSKEFKMYALKNPIASLDSYYSNNKNSTIQHTPVKTNGNQNETYDATVFITTVTILSIIILGLIIGINKYCFILKKIGISSSFYIYDYRNNYYCNAK